MVNKFAIKNPIISEKATMLSALGKYMFLVDRKATAPEIRKALELIYKIDITDINIINIKPKTRRLGRSIGTKPGYKKAIITLKSGQKLDILPH